MKRMICVATLAVVGGLLCGCGQKTPIIPEGDAMPAPVLEQFITQEAPEEHAMPDIAGGWFRTEGEAEWPEEIPKDIPPLEGEIDTVMADGGGVRLFYHGVSEQEVEAYLALLESQGFALEYLVYVQEGFPDNSEERLKQGEYDAVNIARGDTRMRIEYGAGDVTYDISGVTVDTREKWPEELVGRLPQPAGSEISMIIPMQDGSFSIECRTNAADALEQYVAQLEKAGYAVVHESFNQNHEWIDVFLSDGNTTVKARGYTPELLGLQVWLSGSEQLEGVVFPEDKNKKWAESIPDNVPVFGEGVLNSALGTDPITFFYEISDPAALERYTEQLVEAGFVETNRFEGIDGTLISVTFSDGKTSVEVIPMPPTQMGITVRTVQTP